MGKQYAELVARAKRHGWVAVLSHACATYMELDRAGSRYWIVVQPTEAWDGTFEVRSA